MKILSVLFIIFLLENVTCSHHHNFQCKLRKMETAGLVSDVVDRLPKMILQVMYLDKKVDFGNELLPEDVKEAPLLKWNSKKGEYYTLVMVDPDVPSRENPVLRNINHWLVTNIVNNDIKKGEEIVAYVGSLPERKTNLHRYVFLIYKQLKKLTVTEPKVVNHSCENRISFDLRKFCRKYHLGYPLAGNFYFAQWNQYVYTMESSDCPSQNDE